ncbi:hypothetical protein [Cronobacter dublinensis]|jgi:methionine synthase II (cobalamin-independent)|uniref:Uncharacterized protein n=1 Tax=Cronobacter dublinensis TaxID=413497 RepID=A0A9Q4XJ95_9ENTR|nr:hypothetical protein [Cronobacter dublinensis]EGT5659436.1 hypothetical protein [Cronobacter dublinensis subsp. dublinensis]EGT4358788.1 hypothetical protein [Cronobacter dublinensis]EGT5669359.1 hypothetical protein [Cronobacter dublinensis subsp. dublinensis]EGT5673873.1 hypothetical protein [Cronobacter dublinensis subsp. dublinensis]EGT5686275.1 hypothetical protein [Cronobacter dublinensis subsp. dublinensis]
MGIVKPEDMDDIYRVIGKAVSRLIASGIPVETDNIIAQLKDSEEQTVDGTRQIYAEAIRLVASGVDGDMQQWLS